MKVDYAPSDDLMGQNARLNERCTRSILGIPIEIRSNSRSVIVLANEVFAPAPRSRNSGRRSCLMRVIVHGDAECGRDLARPSFTYRAHGDTLLAAASGVLMAVDRRRGAALAFVAPAPLGDRELFTVNVLEFLALSMAAVRDRTPVHAGCVVAGGVGLVLAGASGCGKSTLTYAALRSGRFRILSEDAAYVSVKSRIRLWGHPRRLCLNPDVVRFFPELEGRDAELQPSGKMKIRVAIPESQAAASVADGVFCLLARSDAQPSVEPLTADEIRGHLRALEPGFDLHAREIAGVAERLAARGGYRLKVGPDPLEGVELLARVAAGLA